MVLMFWSGGDMTDVGAVRAWASCTMELIVKKLLPRGVT
jgi:hypothetical protein